MDTLTLRCVKKFQFGFFHGSMLRGWIFFNRVETEVEVLELEIYVLKQIKYQKRLFWEMNDQFSTHLSVWKHHHLHLKREKKKIMPSNEIQIYFQHIPLKETISSCFPIPFIQNEQKRMYLFVSHYSLCINYTHILSTFINNF